MPSPSGTASCCCFNPTLVRLRPAEWAADGLLGLRRFNPTLVRLRRPRRRQVSILRSWFQSHAGSIEAGACWTRRGPGICGFNPTLVRLRPGARGAVIRDEMRFQSHAGSIEAGVSMDEGTKRILGFNPTLVRLRLFSSGSYDTPRSLFQSHAGSIEAGPGGGWERDRRIQFQSHAGSIEARRRGRSGGGFCCFNPTLVRLRPSWRGAWSRGPMVSIPRWFD